MSTRRRADARLRSLLAGAAALACAAPAAATAAPEEIQVYLDDVNEPRELTLELHANYVVEGVPAPDYPGQLPTRHVLQVTPEFSYGIAKNWDAGLYLLSARAADGTLYGNGAKLRLKYVAPSGGAFFWGVNFELGRTSHRVTESNDNFELRPILGWRSTAWLVALNPIVDAALSAGAGREPVFAPALKVSRTVADGIQVGIEHYAEIGPIHQVPDFNQQNHMLFGALDVQKGALDLNFGVGRGLTSASEKWVVKMIVGIPLR